jgi:malate dehydrogenase (oxaloacetate-decarboxylating)(NADP+)
MAANPIVFALANPDPEIAYETALAAREDVVIATGRSDHPNQVNNVLGFPYIFRGALDVRATTINEEMKLAAAKAIAKLAKEAVPEIVTKAYGESNLSFGRLYLIPKPVDPRLITTIAPAVAKAAIESGVAKKIITDWDAYEVELQKRIGIDERLMSIVIGRAKKDPKRVVFGEADNLKILKAAQQIRDEKIAVPILLGNRQRILELIEENTLDLEGVSIRSEKTAQRNDAIGCQPFGEGTKLFRCFDGGNRRGRLLYFWPHPRLPKDNFTFTTNDWS